MPLFILIQSSAVDSDDYLHDHSERRMQDRHTASPLFPTMSGV